MRWISFILTACVSVFVSCDLIDPEFDNPLDVQNNKPPALLISPEDYASSLGQSVEMSLYALEVEGVAGMRAQVNYDDTMVEVTQVVPGTFFDSNQSPLFVYDDDKNGTIDVYSVFLGSNKQVSGTGNIAIITFRVISNGETVIQISNESQLLDSNGNSVPIQSFGEGMIRAQ